MARSQLAKNAPLRLLAFESALPVNRPPSGADKQERGVHNATKQLAVSTKPFCRTDEDFRKQGLVTAEEWAQSGPTMWDITLVTAEHQKC